MCIQAFYNYISCECGDFSVAPVNEGSPTSTQETYRQVDRILIYTLELKLWQLPHKDPFLVEKQLNVIYEVPCTCNTYVRLLERRLKEHRHLCKMPYR